MSAPSTAAATDRGERRRPRRAPWRARPRSASASKPAHLDAGRRSARPIEPPIRPVPTSATAIRGCHARHATRGRSSRRVRAPSRYTWCSSLARLGRCSRCMSTRMHQRHRRRRSPSSRRADQRDVAEPERPRRGRRELGGEVVGGGEDDADDVLVLDLVAVEHLLDQRLRLDVDLGLRCSRRTWSRRAAPAALTGRG